MCPADIPNALFYKRQEYITSYCWNGCMLYGPNKPTLYYQPGNVGYNQTFKVSQFKSDDIVLWENDETLVTDAGEWDNCCSDPAALRYSKRHGRGATIGNADGSAERIDTRVFSAMEGCPTANRIYCVPTTANGRWW